MTNRSHLSVGTLLALLVLALIVAACASATPASPTATPAPIKPAAATAGPVAGPAKPAAGQPAKKLDLPMGVDADGNFYRGDPKAPVKLVEFSDFQ